MTRPVPENYDYPIMVSAPIPENETDRLQKLHDYEILDTATEQDYDDIARLVTEICNTPISTISFVDRDRQWFKAGIGVSSRETSRDVAFCAHTILGDDIFTVHDASADPRFDDNPLVTIDPRLKFYAGVPLITPDGYRLGALCAIDRKPRTLTAQQEEGLRILARHVVDLLELRRSRKELEIQNQQLTELSDMKSRLMSIMAHDLRSPIATLHSFMALFDSGDLSREEQRKVIADLGKVLDSTRYLMDNVIGWASRSLENTRFQVSEIDLEQFARELTESLHHEAERKSNALVVEISPAARDRRVVRSDLNILVFVVRNILANANKFTARGTITLRIDVEGNATRFVVADTGVGMSDATRASLFDWSTRSGKPGTSGEKGAGLALLFCHDFVRRMGGTLTVESSPGAGTTMTGSVPELAQLS